MDEETGGWINETHDDLLMQQRGLPQPGCQLIAGLSASGQGGSQAISVGRLVGRRSDLHVCRKPSGLLHSFEFN